jgi:uncharacterized membrane-anchored protein
MAAQNSEVGKRLREAVAAGDYAEAIRLVDVCRQELDQVLPSAGPERAAALCAEARELLERARRAVCADRTRLGERLARVVRIRLYGSPRPRGAARTDVIG